MGGGYGFGGRSDSNEALNYMSMPQYKGIHGPFPIVFGHITNSSIHSVIVTISGKDAGEYHAKLIDYGAGQRLWYIVLPSSATDPYGIIAYNGEGDEVANQSFDDSRDVDSVLMT